MGVQVLPNGWSQWLDTEKVNSLSGQLSTDRCRDRVHVWIGAIHRSVGDRRATATQPMNIEAPNRR